MSRLLKYDYDKLSLTDQFKKLNAMVIICFILLICQLASLSAHRQDYRCNKKVSTSFMFHFTYNKTTCHPNNCYKCIVCIIQTTPIFTLKR